MFSLAPPCVFGDEILRDSEHLHFHHSEHDHSNKYSDLFLPVDHSGKYDYTIKVSTTTAKLYQIDKSIFLRAFGKEIRKGIYKKLKHTTDIRAKSFAEKIEKEINI